MNSASCARTAATRNVTTWVFAVCLGAAVLSAPRPAGAGEATALESVSVEMIQSRIDQVTSNSDLDDSTKTALADLYQKVLIHARAADDWGARTAGFDKAVTEAPARLAAIRANLDAPQPQASPEVPPDASLEQLEQLLAQAEAGLAAAQKQAVDLDAEIKFRSDRRTEVPKLAAAAQQRLSEINQQMALPLPADEPHAVTEARQALRIAQKHAVEKELASYEKETLSYTARGDLLTSRRDQAALAVARAEKLASAWRDIVSERRRRDAQEAARTADEARRASTRAHPEVQKLAEENSSLADERAGRIAKIERVSNELPAVRKTLTDLQKDAQNVKNRVDRSGITQAMSLLLRRQRAELPDLRYYRNRIDARQTELAAVQLSYFERKEESAALLDTEDEVSNALERIDPSLSPERREGLELEIRTLLKARREYLDSLKSDLDFYLVNLEDLDIAERQLVDETIRYAGYIDSKILWFRSANPFGLADLQHGWKATLWLTSPANWRQVLRALAIDARRNIPFYFLALVGFAALFVVRRRLTTRLQDLAPLVRRASTDSFLYTLAAFAMTVAVAAWWPLLIAFFALRLYGADESYQFAKAVAVGLRTTAALFFTTEFVWQTCGGQGLAEAHFQWRRDGLKTLRKNLFWLICITVPLAFIFSTVGWQQESDLWQDSLGRAALAASLLALAFFALRVLKPSGSVMADFLRRNPGGWLDRLRYIWYSLSVGIPVAVAFLAVLGFQYTAVQLTARFVYTLWLILAVMFVNAVVLRWLFVVHRRLALKRAIEERAEARARESAWQPPTETTEPVDEPEMDFSSVSAQARRLAKSLVGAALIVGLWLIWDDVLPALNILEEVQLWKVATDRVVTAQNLALALLVTALTIVAGRNIPGLLEIAVLQHLPVDHGVRYAVATVARYIITFIGIVIAFGVMGIGWSKIQWLVAAMTVGLGFGLQEIFANFISGLIILFERPMRLGDTVTVGGVTGTVTRIQMRATTVRDWDRKELVVPNKEFITGQIINWTLSDPIIRVIIPVGVAYGSDTDLAHKLLLETARKNHHVLDDPVPTALFMGFGESSLDFELRVFILSVEYFLRVRHELHMAIDRAFRTAGIEIAFPQHDIHVRSISPAIDITRKKTDAPPETPDMPA